MHQKLCQEKTVRLQHKEESFAAYIHNIKDTTLVFLSAASGSDIITNNGEVLCPIQCSQFVFQQHPQNFPNFDYLAIVDQVLHVQTTCMIMV